MPLPESLAYEHLLARVGKKLGYTRTSTNWDTEQSAEIVDVVRDGIRRFMGEREWNFLKIWKRFTTVAGAAGYNLPDDVGYIEGNLYFDANVAYTEVALTDSETIHRLQQQSVSSGVPRYAAYRPKEGAYVMPQVSELVLWPTPDAVYALNYRARLLPEALNANLDTIYALGSMLHQATMLYACLAMAELRGDDAPGADEAMYQAELERSKDRDARAYAGRTLGRFGNGRGRSSDGGVRPDMTLTIDQ